MRFAPAGRPRLGPGAGVRDVLRPRRREFAGRFRFQKKISKCTRNQHLFKALIHNNYIENGYLSYCSSLPGIDRNGHSAKEKGRAPFPEGEQYRFRYDPPCGGNRAGAAELPPGARRSPFSGARSMPTVSDGRSCRLRRRGVRSEDCGHESRRGAWAAAGSHTERLRGRIRQGARRGPGDGVQLRPSHTHWRSAGRGGGGRPGGSRAKRSRPPHRVRYGGERQPRAERRSGLAPRVLPGRGAPTGLARLGVVCTGHPHVSPEQLYGSWSRSWRGSSSKASRRISPRASC